MTNKPLRCKVNLHRFNTIIPGWSCGPFGSAFRRCTLCGTVQAYTSYYLHDKVWGPYEKDFEKLLEIIERRVLTGEVEGDCFLELFPPPRL